MALAIGWCVCLNAICLCFVLKPMNRNSIERLSDRARHKRSDDEN